MTQDDDDQKPPRGLFGPLYWIMMALAALCICGGGAGGLQGSRMFAAPATRF